MNTSQPPQNLRFAAFELDLRARELRKDGRSTGLPDQSITILAMLLERPGELVLREDIRTTLWPNDTVVEFDHSINSAIGRLRQALGDSAEKPRFIETLPRRGYRWIGPAIPNETHEPIGKTPAVLVEPTSLRTPDSTLIGKKVSHYRVLEVLGGGGMGVVYKAEDLKLGRRVALKFLPEEIASDIAARQRFESEARSASALNHPNICTIYSVEDFAGQPFLAMELLQGQTLRDLIGTAPQQRPQLTLANLLDLSIQITSGLHAAHKHGIIHRDIKPANIFVTSEGQAKILDFGLAKATLSESAAEVSSAADPHPEPASYHADHEAESLTASSPFLSRTGVAMGTAGYMSPEQVRGEKLDVRTDLFSFGLVLYEMATGKRAFSGATGPELKQAILTQTPSPARKLNPDLPEKLAKIVHRALEKNREARYQAASEMRVDLDNLKREIEPGTPLRGRALAAVGFGIVLIVSAGVWLARRQPQPSGALPEIKLRQLTTNSSENRVTSGSISPDGKYLTYVDTLGMHLRLIDTGETRAVPPPDELKKGSFEWTIVDGRIWLPDSTRFVVLLHAPGISFNDLSSLNCSLWVVSVLGGPPHKLRDHAAFGGGSISPDGSWIGFDTNHGWLGEREIWVMQPDGSRAHKVFETDEFGSLDGLVWSPDGQRVIYVKTELKNKSAAPHWKENYSSFPVPLEELNQSMISADLKDGPQIPLVLPFDIGAVDEFMWLADGRMIYELRDPGFRSDACNLWQARLDQHTNQFIGKPQRLTNLPDICASNLSNTADGKRLVFLQTQNHASVYVADLQAGGTRITTPTRLTLDEGWNNPGTWSADGKVVFFYSNRNGKSTFFRQKLGQDTAEPLVAARENESSLGGFCLNPDGLSLLYGPVQSPAQPDRYMRVPVSGGASQVIYTGELYFGPQCSTSPATLCVVGERSADRKQIFFHSFDSEKGIGPQLAEFATLPEVAYQSRLSPDGTRIAVYRSGADRIHILWVNGRVPQEITLKGWNLDDGVFWSADSKSLFVNSHRERVPVVLHVDLQGNAKVLWEVQGGTATYAIPSPDGRRLAMQKMTNDGNLWMMENF